MRWLWLPWAAIIFCRLSDGQESYQEEPLHYVALQGDLNLALNSSQQYTKGRVINPVNGRTITEWQYDNSTDSDDGNTTLSCGLISRAGTYTLQLKYDDDRWIDYQELRVAWPAMMVQAPSELVNYRTAFQVKIQWIHLKCYPPAEANITVVAQVVHCGQRDNSSATKNCSAPLVRATQTVQNVWQTGGTGTDIRFDCQTLDHPGYYRIFVREERDPDNWIGISELIHVELNEEFQLQVRAKFALPCRRELPIFYRRPACVTGEQDRVRLYGKTFASNLTSLEFSLNYIGERRLDSNRSAVAFPCQMLDGLSFDSLCFHYVILAPSDGAVIDITQICIPSRNTSMFVEPEWGSWSAFSECTSRNCGYTGVRYRYRYCEQTSPRYAGSFCPGQPIETVTCQGPICPIKPPPNKLEMGIERTLKANLTSDCKCGCTLELGDGTFSLVVSSALCPNGYSTWAFTAPSFSHFHLILDYLRLDCHEDDRLAIRDGISIYSQLIALHDGAAPVGGLLSTSSSQLLIEFNVSSQPSFFAPSSKCVAGFVASITSVPKEEEDVAQVERRTKLEDMLPPPVLTLSSVLLMLLFTVSILVVLYSRCGFNLKHGRTKNRKCSASRSKDINSLWSEESEYQLVSTATSICSIETQETIDDGDRKGNWSFPSRFANLIRLQKSLPNSPFLSTSRHARRIKKLSRSSTLSPVGLRSHNQLETMLRSGINSGHGQYPEDIEMSLINHSESDATLKGEKLVHTANNRISMASQSLADETKSIGHSTCTQSCSAVFDPDQDLEFDYYDLDVRNAGCNAPDSFLRCLADDSVYWDEAEIEKSLQDADDFDSMDGSLEISETLDEDEILAA